MMAGVLDKSSADSSAADLAGADKKADVIVFNEQTNYVPTRTIITVRTWSTGKAML